MTSADFRNGLLEASLVLREAIETCVTPVCRRYGLSPQQFHVLMVLEKHGSQSAGELSDRVGIHRGNITAVCKKLEQKDLIVRSRSPEDERVVVISMGDTGEQLLQEMAEEFDRCYERLLEEESPEEIEEIIEGISKLCRLARNERKE